MNERLKRLRRILKRLSIDALLVSNPSNIFYLTGFAGQDSLLVVSRSSAHIITDFRYKEEARMCGPGFTVVSEKGGLNEKAACITRKLPLAVTRMQFSVVPDILSYIIKN